MPCPSECGYTGDNLEYHFRHSPYCRPVDAPTEVWKKRRARDGVASARTYANQVSTKIGKELLTAHTNNYVKLEHWEIMKNLIVAVVGLTIKFIGDESKMGDITIEDILQSAYAPFESMPDASALIKQRRKIYQRAIPRAIGQDKFTSEDKKGARARAVRFVRCPSGCFTGLDSTIGSRSAARPLPRKQKTSGYVFMGG